MLKGFKEFVVKGNVVDLAVGVIMGVSFSNVVTAAVRDIISPLIAIFGGSPSVCGFSITINHATFMIGDFFNTILSFVINAAVVYFVIVLPMNKLKTITTKQSPTTTKMCPQCCSQIADQAKKCPFCTSRQ